MHKPTPLKDAGLALLIAACFIAMGMSEMGLFGY